MVSAILFVLVLGFLFLGVPVAISLGLSSIVVIAFFSTTSMSSVALQLFSASQHYTLLAIPFFILASAFMSTGGVARRIIRFAIAAVGHFRGGLAMASVLAGIIPGIVAGLMLMIAIYIVARIKKLPAEPWRGFGEIMQGGKQAGWGLFLIVIILGGIYGGVFTPTEAAAVAAVYSFFIALFVYRDMGTMKDTPWVKEGAPQKTRIGFSATVYGVSIFLVWMLMSFFMFSENETLSGNQSLWIGLALGGTIMIAYILWRDPKSSVVGIPGHLVASLPVWAQNLSLMVRNAPRAFFNSETRKVVLDAARTTIMLMFIIVNALLIAHVLTSERIPQIITGAMLDAGFNWFTFLIAVNIILLIGGQFMEPSGLLLIVAPVVFPIAMELGIDPIHLGIIMVVNMEIGMITPPSGSTCL